jgi:hypothetical protein
MTEFNPPISSRDTDELILIANGTTEDWQQEGIDQAIIELKKRNVTSEYQNKIISDWKSEIKKNEIEYQEKLELNKNESYSMAKMIYIFITAPLIIFGKWTIDYSLFELKQENYIKKYRQRILLLIGGFSFWILVLMTNGNDFEKKRQQEIDSADISEWERNYYGNDSLKKND